RKWHLFAVASYHSKPVVDALPAIVEQGFQITPCEQRMRAGAKWPVGHYIADVIGDERTFLAWVVELHVFPQFERTFELPVDESPRRGPVEHVRPPAERQQAPAERVIQEGTGSQLNRQWCV